jgi:hypothetical protein
MTKQEAQRTALARGFKDVKHWMAENRRAAAQFRASRDQRKHSLADALDTEWQRVKSTTNQHRTACD